MEVDEMPDSKKQADQMRDEVPSTIARSDDKAVRTFKKTLESAEESYGEGERARRTAMASLKHTHEKVGDHWEPKNARVPRIRRRLRAPLSRDRALGRPRREWTPTPASSISWKWPGGSASRR